MRAPVLGLIALILTALGSLGQRAAAQPLIADLSDHVIAIEADFTGDEVVLFGAIGQPGDVVVTGAGPDRSILVRRQEPVGGIWMNREAIRFDDVPSFYAVAASAELASLGPAVMRERHRLGVASLALRPADPAVDPETAAAFRAALVRQMQKDGLYGQRPGVVQFLGSSLFRTTIAFPSTLPTGAYTIAVYLIADGAVVAAQTTPLLVSKSGFMNELFLFSRRHAVAYGIACVVIAVLAGWLSSLVFRRA